MANIYENENYAVVVFAGKYIVVNKNTAVEEHETKQYPEALMAAASLNKAIKDEVWKYASGEKQDPMIAEMERMLGGGGPGVPPAPASNDPTFN